MWLVAADEARRERAVPQLRVLAAPGCTCPQPLVERPTLSNSSNRQAMFAPAPMVQTGAPYLRINRMKRSSNVSAL